MYSIGPTDSPLREPKPSNHQRNRWETLELPPQPCIAVEKLVCWSSFDYLSLYDLGGIAATERLPTNLR